MYRLILFVKFSQMIYENKICRQYSKYFDRIKLLLIKLLFKFNSNLREIS